ncbi:anaerobic sulfatase maturase [uncultured Cohaesibacter sp.]|uniref:anaerobic sulfatase maturase n=1 Tax=uncultured Cohaesibacter sp. TaxID=1002546 RepID=UPI0029C6397B|nr:anaerobic sulfatase maturase [uncultured Cohaesibacter sp.]
MPTEMRRPFQVMAKPIGPRCNLDCTYCYYLEKERLYEGTKRFDMSETVLETYIRDYIDSQASLPEPEIWFNWQGGEPTILGLSYFRQIVELQKRYQPSGKTIRNAMQTNGTLITDEWARFLKQEDFLVGISIDGSEEINDQYRVDRAGRPSFKAVMVGLEHLKAHGVSFNVLTVVHRDNAQKPLEVYRFLRDIGAEYIQFIPIVERSADGKTLAAAPQIDEDGVEYHVTPWSVLPRTYGTFLSTIFDEWVSKDVGKIFVQFFDLQLGLWMGAPASLCWFAETCGQGLAVEHNGDLYACDHYVYPEYRLGNITETFIAELANSEQQISFGEDKRDSLPRQCRECDVRFACNGGCPKHRFLTTADGEPGLNYYCRSIKHFAKHAGPTLEIMRSLVQSGRPASDIMTLNSKAKGGSPHMASRVRTPGRNDPCPCGSGKKYKACCGKL